MSLDAKNLIGMDITQAAVLVHKSNLEVRIVFRDGFINKAASPCCGKAPIVKQDRVNLKILNNKVVDAYVG